MEVWINLKFGDGDFERGFSQIKIQIDTLSTQTNLTQLETQLSPAQEIPNSYERWKESYDLLANPYKRGFKKYQITHISTDTCLKYTKSLQSKLNLWLLPIKSQLEPVIPSDTNYNIRLVINTHGVTSESTKNILHHLPWQECNLFGKHSSLEVALSFKDSLFSTREAIKPNSEFFRRIKIISILGDSRNIDTSTDEELIIDLEKRGAYTTFWKEPKRETLHKLWDEPCDILFFAGHSASLEDGKKGIIYINANEKLDLEDIPKTLKSAIDRGLQLAIFNSCDGLGLAQRLACLNLPYVIVWREPVPDKIAHKFLNFFLSSYAGGDSLFTAVWKARGKLLELTSSEKEKLLPGVSWLPIICKNTLELPPKWEDLGGLSGKLPHCPYKDLSAFGEEDAPFFFGREKFVEQLVAAVQSKSLVPVVGASGSGKSSVVFAGLVPHLRKTENVEIISFRPGKNPLGNLAIALKNHCHLSAPLQGENSTAEQRRLDELILEVDLRHDRARLTQIIENTIALPSATKKLVLIADQFEELYTLTPQEERQPFLDALIYAIDRAPRFTLVLTLRADFYGYALSYRPFSDALQKGIYNLSPMNREELRCAIEKPAHKMKIELESGLSDTLIRDLGDASGRLPLLQFTLTTLWLKPRKWFLTHEAYQEIGGLEKALANYADRILDKLSQDDQKRAEKIFIQLVCPGEGTEDTRRLATRQEVGEANWDLVQQLASERLLVTGYDETSENKSETVEIIHEALIRECKWIQDNREFRTWQERLRGAMRQWEETQQDEGALLRGAALLEAEERLEERRDDLSQDEQNYIQQSIELRERLIKQENERRKRQLLAASIVTMFFAGLSFFSGFQWRNSEINQIHSLTESSEALLVSNKKLDALISSLHAGKKLNQPLLQIFPPTTALKNKVKRNLQKVVYQVQERNRLNGNGFEVSFISDNQHLVTVGDGTIKLWNFQGQQLLTWQTKLSITSISISPNGQIVATAGENGIIALWNLKGQQLSTWKGNQGWIRSISFSPNGQLLATGGEEGTRLWNLQGQQLAKLEGDRGWVWSVRFSPNGQLLASGGSDGTIRLWNLQGQQLAKLPGHVQPVRSISFSPDGQKLATAGDDSTVCLWNLQGKQLIRQWQENQHGVWFVSFSPDGQKLVIGKHNSTAYLRDLQGNELSKFTHLKGPIRSMSFSLDGKRLATAGDDDTVYLWDLQGKHLSEFTHHKGHVTKVSFNLDGQRLATAGDDRTIRWWNLQGQELKAIKGHLVSFSQDGKQIATAEDDGSVSLWDFQSKQLFKFTAHQGRVRKVSFSSDSQRLATVGDDRIIRLWNLQGQKLFQSPVLADTNFNFKSLSFSPDASLLTAITDEGSVSVWNLRGEKLVQSPIPDVNSHFKRLIFSPNSRLLAAVINSGSVSVWDLQSSKKINLAGHPNGTSSVIFYSNSQQLATAGDDGTIRLWDLQGKQLDKFTVHQGFIFSLSLSSNGQQLATTGDDGTVRLWNFQGQQLAEFPANSWNVSFSPDGQQLVTLGVDGTAKLWQIETFEELLKKGCGWVRDYLKTNPNVSQSDRTLCNQ